MNPVLFGFDFLVGSFVRKPTDRCYFLAVLLCPTHQMFFKLLICNYIYLLMVSKHHTHYEQVVCL
jgi:hypothetical protein